MDSSKPIILTDAQLVEAITQIERNMQLLDGDSMSFQRKQACLKLIEAKVWLESTWEYKILSELNKS